MTTPLDDVADFECPRCGSTHWGSSASASVGHCHGDTGCRFSWTRDTDDWRHFRLGGRRFTSPRAFQAWEAQRAAVAVAGER